MIHVVSKPSEWRRCHCCFFWETSLWRKMRKLRLAGQKTLHPFTSIDTCRLRSSEFNFTCITEFNSIWAVETWVANFIFTIGISGWSTVFLFELRGKTELRWSWENQAYTSQPADVDGASLAIYKVCTSIVGALTALLLL